MPERQPQTTPPTTTRLELQRVATHLLARARFAATGRFGLRVTWDGIGTPAFGPDGDVLRIAGGLLVHESQRPGAAGTRAIPLGGRSLGELADWVGVDLATPFSAGAATPAVGDTEAPLSLDAAAGDALLSWYRVGARAIDRLLADLAEPSLLQLWPEHFDLGIDASTGHGRVNLGTSLGDDAHPTPYLYVGPWEADRPGDPGYWNASFGAVLDAADLDRAGDREAGAFAFFRRGLELLG
jgi:hypothetical protein